MTQQSRFNEFINKSGPEVNRITSSVLEGPFLASWVPYGAGIRYSIYHYDEDGDRMVTTVEIRYDNSNFEIKKSIQEALFRRTELYKEKT